MHIFFDTETTGIINYKLPLSHPDQPHIVQLAYIVTDEIGNQIKQVNTLVKPEGWTIPAEAAAVHGITDEMCKQKGEPIWEVLEEFAHYVTTPGAVLVAHNIGFDVAMIESEIERGAARSNFLWGVEQYCTKVGSEPILKLPLTEKQVAAQKRNPDWTPPGGWPKYKAPTMMEAYKHFFGKEFDNAHDALSDVLACKAVYYAINPVAAK